MPSFLDFVRAQRKFLPLVQAESQVAGGTFVVTGSNTGLGYECAKHYIELGASRVILAVRSLQRGNDALERMREATGRREVGEVWEFDLASLGSVEGFCKRLATLDRLDALIANASVALGRFTLTDGTETSSLVNVLATMLLAVRALPTLQKSAGGFGIQPHMVIVASGTAFHVPGAVERIDGNIFEAMADEKNVDMAQQYPLTKLLQVYAVRQLASLFPASETGVIINVLSPGLCVTELSRNASLLSWLQIGLMRMLLGRTAEQGSRTLLHAAVAGPESHGKYVSDCEIKEYAVPDWIKNEESLRSQKRVWVDLVQALEARGHPVNAPKAREVIRS